MSRDRVVDAALSFVDTQGVAALAMRPLAKQLGVEAMALYKHVRNKDALLDALVDRVVTEIEVPPPGTAWRKAMEQRATSARQVFKRHPWAITLFESRVDRGEARLAYGNAILGLLRGGGFSALHAARAFLTLDSYLYGFVLQEVHWPFDGDDPAIAAAMLTPSMTTALPHLVEVMTAFLNDPSASQGLDEEFSYGLGLVLDGLARLRKGSAR